MTLNKKLTDIKSCIVWPDGSAAHPLRHLHSLSIQWVWSGVVFELVFWAVYDYSKFQNKNNHTLDNAGEAINTDIALKKQKDVTCVFLCLLFSFALDIKLLVAAM